MFNVVCACDFSTISFLTFVVKHTACVPNSGGNVVWRPDWDGSGRSEEATPPDVGWPSSISSSEDGQLEMCLSCA